MAFLTWRGLVELLEEIDMVRAEESHVWGQDERWVGTHRGGRVDLGVTGDSDQG